MRKQLEEITREDLEKYPVWYFVSEDDQEADELTIEPASKVEAENDSSVIVRCYFTDNRNRQYIGYINWQTPFSIDAIQPVLFLDAQSKIAFWNGMFLPDVETMDRIGKDFFPISYKSSSELGLKSIDGILEGIYYFDDNDNICSTNK